MILEQETYDKFGHWPNNLPKGSNKKIIAQCEICKGHRNICFVEYQKAKSRRCISCFRFQDLSGKTFGSLVVSTNWRIEVTDNNHKRIWEVTCKCGMKLEVQTTKLTQKRKLSCSRECTFHTTRKGHGELSGSYYKIIERRAKKYNWEFDLDPQYLLELLIRQDFKCALSGIEITMMKEVKFKSIKTASLDRIDSSKGYTKSNVQWVHKTVNIMKQALSDKEFIEWCNMISEHNRSKS